MMDMYVAAMDDRHIWHDMRQALCGQLQACIRMMLHCVHACIHNMRDEMGQPAAHKHMIMQHMPAAHLHAVLRRSTGTV